MRKNKLLIKSILFLFIYFASLYIIGLLTPTILLQYNLINNINQVQVFHNWIFIINHIFLLLIGFLMFKKEYRQAFKLYLHNFFKYLMIAIIGFALILICNSFFTFTTSNQTNIINMLNSMTLFQKGLFTIIISFIGPINEELIFRQILIGNFSKYLSKWVLLIFSSFIFAILHLSSFNNFYEILPYLISGFILGISYIKSNNNIFCSVSIHWINNILSLII